MSEGRRLASSPGDFAALIALGGGLAGGTVILRCHDDEDASYYLGQLVEWAREMGIPVKRDRTWRVQVGDFANPNPLERGGSVEAAPLDYEPGPGEVIRDMPALPKAVTSA